MTRACVGLLLLAGCGATATTESAPAREPAEQQSPIEAAQPGATEPIGSCALAAGPVAAPAIHPDVLRVAPQYFHASHRGGFDTYTGGAPLFPWFDVYDLERAVTPPRNVRVTASTPESLLVVSRDGELGVLARGASTPAWTGEQLYPEEAVERGGELWVLARTGTTRRVFHRGDGRVVDLGVSVLTWDVRLAVTNDGHPVAAWLSQDAGHLRVHVAWDLDVANARVVDEVSLPEPIAALSARSRVDLAIAADGAEGLGVAWRPLIDPTYATVGSASEPPSAPSAAQVRWLSVEPGGERSEVRTHPTTASPLGGVTGVGPWGLSGNGMKARTLGGRALFVWLDDADVLGVLAGSAAPVALAAREGAPLITFQDAETPRLLLLDSSPRVRAVALLCE